MEYILRVENTQPEQRNYLEDGKDVVERQIAVTFAIYAKSGDIVAAEPTTKRTIGFLPDATSDEIKAELAKHLETFKSDMAAVTRSKKAEEANANAIKVAKELDGLEI